MSLTRIIHAFSKRRAGSAALTRLYTREPRSHSHALCRGARGWVTQSERMIPALQPKTRALSGLREQGGVLESFDRIGLEPGFGV